MLVIEVSIVQERVIVRINAHREVFSSASWPSRIEVVSAKRDAMVQPIDNQ